LRIEAGDPPSKTAHGARFANKQDSLRYYWTFSYTVCHLLESARTDRACTLAMADGEVTVTTNQLRPIRSRSRLDNTMRDRRIFSPRLDPSRFVLLAYLLFPSGQREQVRFESKFGKRPRYAHVQIQTSDGLGPFASTSSKEPRESLVIRGHSVRCSSLG